MGLSPEVKEKFGRFRRLKRAWVSFCLLCGILVISLFSEVIAHGKPWLIRFEGRTYFPRIQSLQQDLFLADGVLTEPDYRILELESGRFEEKSGNWMLWSPVRFSPQDTVGPEEIEIDEILEIRLVRVQRVSDLRVNEEGRYRFGRAGDWFERKGAMDFPESLRTALSLRFTNQPAEAFELTSKDGAFAWSLSEFSPRSQPPRTVRMVLRETLPEKQDVELVKLPAGSEERPPWWSSLPEEARQTAEQRIHDALQVPVSPVEFTDADGTLREIRISKETVQFPFRPVKHHPLGLDQSGRDVFVLILYATRISLLFGLTLVVCSMVLGTILGGLQGYFGGKVDLIAQRLIEIYASIPFLYAMIFLGSVFGRSFALLLFVYAIFNWIGMSYYMRAEFLRLRRQPFTEAALSLGLPTSRIMWRHLLPNSLIPIITFFPFSLVGAIGSLSALDYLGFGLPVGTPSWGNLLSQGQEYRYAWWLILYPSLMLFIVILLSVFIGEGLRAAFDPKREVHWDA